MKSFYLFCTAIAVSLLLLAGCQKPDTCTQVSKYTIYTPVFMDIADLRKAVKSEAPHTIQQPGKIYLLGHYIFLNELNKGIHIIDNSNPAAPKIIAFVNIPGNVDMAVRGNILYADSYRDLVTLDISNPAAIKEVKRLEDVFTNRQQLFFTAAADPNKIVVDYELRDTTMTSNCQTIEMIVMDNAVAYQSTKAPSSASMALGKGGSMARFALLGQYLYTVDITSLSAFDIQQPLMPVKKSKTEITGGIMGGGMIETIFPYRTNLFVGGQRGMYIFDASTPESPAMKGRFEHAQKCDPVVVENDLAYITLRAGNTCSPNQESSLMVLDVKDIMAPKLIKSYPMTSPYGLGIDNGNLFVCEGATGIRFMNADDPAAITQLAQEKGLDAFDVIPHNKILLVTAKDGLYQYDYSNMLQPKLLSKINITVKQ